MPTSPITHSEALHRMTELPSLADRYRGLPGFPEVEWSSVPILTKDDFRAAFPDAMHRARTRSYGAIVLGSGGTTSEPKLSLIPSGQYIDEVAAQWQPLTNDDVLVNYDTPGRLCSSHNFFSALADRAGAVMIPMGAVEDEQLEVWLSFMDRLGATAFNATQSHIAHVLGQCESTGRKPPNFAKLLWTGEAFGARALDVVRRVLPEAELHGCYGSTETWVIGHNGPTCAVDTFHLMRYQHVELVDGQVVVTNLHPECLNPVVRYRIGDRGEMVHCPCGRSEPALRVLGRDDPQVKFLSILVAPQEIAQVALADADVTEVQVTLFGHGSPGERIQLRIKTDSAVNHDALAARVRHRVLTDVYRLGYEVADAPHTFDVLVTDRFEINDRSGKTPLLVKEG